MDSWGFEQNQRHFPGEDLMLLEPPVAGAGSSGAGRVTGGKKGAGGVGGADDAPPPLPDKVEDLARPPSSISSPNQVRYLVTYNLEDPKKKQQTGKVIAGTGQGPNNKLFTSTPGVLMVFTDKNNNG